MCYTLLLGTIFYWFCSIVTKVKPWIGCQVKHLLYIEDVKGKGRMAVGINCQLKWATDRLSTTNKLQWYKYHWSSRTRAIGQHSRTLFFPNMESFTKACKWCFYKFLRVEETTKENWESHFTKSICFALFF